MNEIITWQALEFPENEKSADWYWIFGIVVVVGFLIALVLGNFLFGIFILLAGGTLGAFASKKPDLLTCRITKKGVVVEDKLYPFASIDTFWIEDEDDDPKLLMTMRETFAMHVIIPITHEVADDIRDILREYADEELQHEGVAEHLMRIFNI